MPTKYTGPRSWKISYWFCGKPRTRQY